MENKPTTNVVPALTALRFCAVNASGSVVHIFGLNHEADAISCARRKGLRVEKREVEISPAYAATSKGRPSTSRFTRMADFSRSIAMLRGETDCIEAGL